MKIELMKNKIDELFWQFANEKFCPRGTYPYYTELVFTFAEYIEQLTDEEIATMFLINNTSLLRKLVCEGTDKWLRQNAKTMMIM